MRVGVSEGVAVFVGAVAQQIRCVAAQQVLIGIGCGGVVEAAAAVVVVDS